MKSILKKLSFLLLSTILLLGLCSCHLFYEYYEFEFKYIDEIIMREDFEREEYFTSEVFEFASIESVAVIPTIKVAYHHGYGADSEAYGKAMYPIRIFVYSKTGTEKVIIKNVTVKENDSVLLSYEINQSCEFKKYDFDPSVYCSLTEAGPFEEEEINAESDKSYSLIVDAELIKDDEVISKSITYEFVAHGYIGSRLP